MNFGQGGPERGPGGSSTPDWAALAAHTERTRARRRRWMIVGGGALATALIAGIVALAVVNEGGLGGSASDKPSGTLPAPEDLPSSTPGLTEPTFRDEPPPPAPPRDFVSDAKRDKAPLSVSTLFPSAAVTVNGRPYERAATATSKSCASAAHAGLGPVLSRNHCRRVYRATFTHGGLVVTVGIAVFDRSRPAAAVKRQYRPNLVALPGHGVPDFCRTVTCRTTANSYGRYAYFTISGRSSGKPSTSADSAAEQAGRDGSDYAYARILQRGKEQAAAAATASPATE